MVVALFPKQETYDQWPPTSDQKEVSSIHIFPSRSLSPAIRDPVHNLKGLTDISAHKTGDKSFLFTLLSLALSSITYI